MNCCQAAGEQGFARINPSAPALEGKFFHSQKRSFPFHDVGVPFLQRPIAKQIRQPKLAVVTNKRLRSIIWPVLLTPKRTSGAPTGHPA
jgi:hypothetical protein